MAVCEKCWAEAGGIFEKYLELLKQRDCTPQEQAGAVAMAAEFLIGKVLSDNQAKETNMKVTKKEERTK